MNNFLLAVKNHALKNYSKGWDTVVECYSDTQILAIISTARTEKGAIKMVLKDLNSYADYSVEIESTAF